MGVKHLAVLVNKMDVVDYSQEKFNKTVEEVQAVIKQAGYAPDTTPFIPGKCFDGR